MLHFCVDEFGPTGVSWSLFRNVLVPQFPTGETFYKMITRQKVEAYRQVKSCKHVMTPPV
jgi:hypothetical protein